MHFPNIDPSAITIPAIAGFGPFHLRWYALAYIAGLVLGWRWMVWLIRRDRLWTPGKPAMSVPQADDFLFWATLGVILGGRLGYILFYKPDMIWRNPVDMLQIWQGGMSFHGGLLGVIIAAIWFTRQKHVNEDQFATLAKKHAVAEPPADHRADYARVPKLGWLRKKDLDDAREKSRTETVDLLRLGDLAVAAAPIGLFFGRIANFINGELWGRVTDSPFGMIFCNQRILETMGGCPAGVEPRYPSQLFEAVLEGVVLFAIINTMTLKYDSLRRPGLNSGVFLACYGLFRAILETVREPDAHMPEFLRGYITMGMLLSIPMIVAGAWLVRRAWAQPKLAAA
jgi:phosphatidylglycerol:prolipoprotein diacylglycerol transferase